MNLMTKGLKNVLNSSLAEYKLIFEGKQCSESKPDKFVYSCSIGHFHVADSKTDNDALLLYLYQTGIINHYLRQLYSVLTIHYTPPPFKLKHQIAIYAVAHILNVPQDNHPA